LVSRGRADARDLPGPQQVLRGRRPRRRCRGPGLGRDLGAYEQEVGLLSALTHKRQSFVPEVVISRHRVSPSASPTTGSSGVSGKLRLRDLSLALWNTGSSAFADD